MRHWILQSKEHTEAVWIPDGGDQYVYEIAPAFGLKRGDIIYLWSNPHSSFFGWGEVSETPRQNTVEVPRPGGDIEKRKRTSVVVNRKAEFRPPITQLMMLRDGNLKKLIPKGFNDLEAIPLRPGQANYLNDFVRLQGSQAPEGSEAVGIRIQEPQLLIKSILSFEGKTDEGRIVRAVMQPWYDIIEILTKDPKAAFQITPERWEEIVAGAYKESDFDDVILTPRSGDYGRDVIAVKKGVATVRVIDQVKAYSPDHRVTADDVRALLGVLQGDGASKGFLTTTSDFAPGLRTDPLITPFIPSRLELIDGHRLLKRLIELRNKNV